MLGFRAADGELLARARRTASSRRAWRMAGVADGEGDGGGAENWQPDGVMFGGAFVDLCLRLQMDLGGEEEGSYKCQGPLVPVCGSNRD